MPKGVKKRKNEETEELAVETIAKNLPEIADAMVNQAIGGNTTAAKVCLDILNRTPTPIKQKLEEIKLTKEVKGLEGREGTVYVLTHLADGSDDRESG